MAAAIVRVEKYTHDHIYKTDPPIFIKFVAKCSSFRPHSSEMKDNLCDRIPLSYNMLAKLGKCQNSWNKITNKHKCVYAN